MWCLVTGAGDGEYYETGGQLELTSILGQVVSMARNQRGSRVLQEALEEQALTYRLFWLGFC